MVKKKEDDIPDWVTDEIKKKISCCKVKLGRKQVC